MIRTSNLSRRESFGSVGALSTFSNMYNNYDTDYNDDPKDDDDDDDNYSLASSRFQQQLQYDDQALLNLMSKLSGGSSNNKSTADRTTRTTTPVVIASSNDSVLETVGAQFDEEDDLTDDVISKHLKALTLTTSSCKKQQQVKSRSKRRGSAGTASSIKFSDDMSYATYDTRILEDLGSDYDDDDDDDDESDEDDEDEDVYAEVDEVMQRLSTLIQTSDNNNSSTNNVVEAPTNDKGRREILQQMSNQGILDYEHAPNSATSKKVWLAQLATELLQEVDETMYNNDDEVNDTYTDDQYVSYKSNLDSNNDANNNDAQSVGCMSVIEIYNHNVRLLEKEAEQATKLMTRTVTPTNKNTKKQQQETTIYMSDKKEKQQSPQPVIQHQKSIKLDNYFNDTKSVSEPSTPKKTKPVLTVVKNENITTDNKKPIMTLTASTSISPIQKSPTSTIIKPSLSSSSGKQTVTSSTTATQKPFIGSNNLESKENDTVPSWLQHRVKTSLPSSTAPSTDSTIPNFKTNSSQSAPQIQLKPVERTEKKLVASENSAKEQEENKVTLHHVEQSTNSVVDTTKSTMVYTNIIIPSGFPPYPGHGPKWPWHPDSPRAPDGYKEIYMLHMGEYYHTYMTYLQLRANNIMVDTRTNDDDYDMLRYTLESEATSYKDHLPQQSYTNQIHTPKNSKIKKITTDTNITVSPSIDNAKALRIKSTSTSNSGTSRARENSVVPVVSVKKVDQQHLNTATTSTTSGSTSARNIVLNSSHQDVNTNSTAVLTGKVHSKSKGKRGTIVIVSGNELDHRRNQQQQQQEPIKIQERSSNSKIDGNDSLKYRPTSELATTTRSTKESITASTTEVDILNAQCQCTIM